MYSPDVKKIYDGRGIFVGFNCCGFTVFKDVEISKNFRRPFGINIWKNKTPVMLRYKLPFILV